MHEGDGMKPADARDIAHRQGYIAGLLSEGVEDLGEIARRVGRSKRTVEYDIAALRRLLEPRVTFVGEREAA